MTAEAPRPPATAAGRRSLWQNPYLWAFLGGIVFLTVMRPFLRHVPDPPPVLGQLPPFTLVDQQGAPFGSNELAGKVWVANFVFTRCVAICPTLTRSMASLQSRYENAGVEGIHLVSISVDPEHDTPERLRDYGAAHGVDPRRWSLLTGEGDRVQDLVRNGFKTAVERPEPRTDSMVDIAHTGKFVLVDGEGGIRGYYDSDGPGLDEIFHRSLHVLDQQRR